MKSLLVFTLSLLVYISNAQHQSVNPFIGTGGHGHTFPGATLPFGMVQLSPDTRIDGSWDGCSGYHYSDNVIYGFSHTHLNGTGVSDFGDIMLMPTMGEANLSKEAYSSAFSHANETASAGYYAVKLDKDNIDVALTASTRVGFHEYTFNKAGQANIILDLNHRDHLLMGNVRIIDDRTIEVFRESEAWARDQYVYARIMFDRPMRITKVNNNAFAPAKTTDKQFAGSLLAIAFSTDVKAGDKIKVKVAISPTGYEGAALNMSEIKDWDFNKTRKAAEKAWDNELGKITISESDKNKKTVFYTALYHTMMQPNIAQDIDGKYRGRDNAIHQAEGFNYYSVFSLWDTFRAANPLYTLIDKKRTSDFVNTFLKQYKQGGRLPVWELASNETDCMIGYHAVSVIADAMAKGIKGFDYKEAYEAAKHSAMLDHLGLSAYKKNGFIAIDDEHESVSKTVEYAYDDWCIAQMARLLNDFEGYGYFMDRSQNWKNIFDAKTGFMRPKRNGGWDAPFDPREINNNFTEGNSWQYSFFVPQDIPGMVMAYGGDKAFEAKLDEMFSSPSATTGREQVDVTGLIGQYAHGNEPSHHMAWLYTFVKKPAKTQEKISYILDNFYKNTPDGLIGNEDCGQMSAWYVLSSLGMYAVTPGNPEWTTNKPYFSKIKVRLEDGSQLKITTGQPAPKNAGIKRKPQPAPPYNEIVPVPVIETDKKSFRDSASVVIRSYNIPRQLRYLPMYKMETEDRKDEGFSIYNQPLNITTSGKIYAFSVDSEDSMKTSDTIVATFVKKPNDYTIALQSTYNPQYHAGGPEGLIDGIYGTENWRKGDWQGYQGQDFEAVVDLGKIKTIQTISANFLQDSRSWILMPAKVEYATSEDGIHFTFLKTIANTVDPHIGDTVIKDFPASVNPVKARFVKVKATNFGTLPQWHQGSGGQAFIFIDEIRIE